MMAKTGVVPLDAWMHTVPKVLKVQAWDSWGFVLYVHKDRNIRVNVGRYAFTAPENPGKWYVELATVVGTCITGWIILQPFDTIDEALAAGLEAFNRKLTPDQWQEQPEWGKTASSI